MKKILPVIVIFVIFIAAVPFISGFISGIRDIRGRDDEEQSSFAGYDDDGITDNIFMTDESTIPSDGMTVREYVIRAVMAEIPYTAPEEALKAQAVAVRTALCRSISHGAAPSAELLDEEKARRYYGDAYTAAYERISAAADSTSGLILTYRGSPVIAAFHPYNSGRTESAEYVLGEAVPYLISVRSPYDEGYPVQRRVFTYAEARARLITEHTDIDIPQNGRIFGGYMTSSAGTVTEIAAGDKVLEGSEIMRIFSLPSAVFTVKQSEEYVTFEIHGCSHCMGMSVYGAEKYAEHGMSFEEILLHYYPGTKLTKASYQSVEEEKSGVSRSSRNE